MQDFWIFIKIGLHHVLDLNGYDHILFLMALTAPYAFKDWKRILILVSIFTIGHTMSLLLSIFDIVVVKANLIEFLIPITILLTAFYNLFAAGKNSKNNTLTFIGFVTLFFGVIHGLGFSNYFKTILSGSALDKLVPTVEFSLGIEAAQVCIVVCVLLLSFVCQTLLKFNKRDFTLILSSFVIGVVVPMLLSNPIFKK